MGNITPFQGYIAPSDFLMQACHKQLPASPADTTFRLNNHMK